jgi:hypothetical protein
MENEQKKGDQQHKKKQKKGILVDLNSDSFTTQYNNPRILFHFN